MNTPTSITQHIIDKLGGYTTDGSFKDKVDKSKQQNPIPNQDVHLTKEYSKF